MERNNSLNPTFGDSDFASEGHEVKFDWFAYANYYSPTTHNITEQYHKENQRKTYMYSSHNGVVKELYESINSNQRILYKVKKPFVIDTTAYAPGGDVLGAFVRILAQFFETGKIIDQFPRGTDPWQMYKGKDLIMPLLFCDKDALEFLEWKANQYIENGAHSVTVIFVFRIMPNSNGEYPIHSDYPQVTEYSFAETLNLNGDGDFLSQLAQAAEENFHTRRKYKLL